jgi:hypothetical protein
MGAVPIDFDEFFIEYQKIDICSLKSKGINKIGCVFNLDKHNERGSHWVSMFIDVDEQIIFYFDSANDKIPDEMKKLVDRIKTQGLYLKKPVHFKYYDSARARHQMGSTECGMYSLYFIINMLRDKTNKQLLKSQRVPDSLMTNYRKVYFN